MSPCVNGTSKLFSCAKSSPAVRTKVMESTSRAWPVCPKKFSTAPKKFSRTWKIQALLRQSQGHEEKKRRSRCPRPKNRSSICCETRDSSTSLGKTNHQLALAQTWPLPRIRGSQTGAPWGNHAEPASIEAPETRPTREPKCAEEFIVGDAAVDLRAARFGLGFVRRIVLIYHVDVSVAR